MRSRRVAGWLAGVACLVALPAAAGAQDTPDEPGAAPPPTTAAPLQGQPPPGAEVRPTLGRLFDDRTIGEHPDAAYEFYYGAKTIEVDVGDAAGDVQGGTAIPGADLVGAITNKISPPVDTNIPDPGRSATGWAAGLIWMVVQTLATLVRSLTAWGLGGRIFRALGDLVAKATRFLDGEVAGPLRLRDFAALGAAVVIAWRMLRSGISRALPEVLIVCVFVAVSWVMLAYPERYFDTIANGTSQVAQLGFRLANPTDPGQALSTAEQSMKKAQTDIPWQHVNFGRELDGKCLEAANDILAHGPYAATDARVQEAMQKAGCKAEVAYNSDPQKGRLGQVIVLGLAVLAAAFFAVACIVTLIKAVIMLAWHITYGFLVFIVGQVPAFRDTVWNWLRSIATDIVAMVVPAWTLGAMVLADLAVFQISDWPIGYRLGLMAGINWAIFHYRKPVVNLVASKLTGQINRASTRTNRAEHKGTLKSAARERDFFPGRELVTVPLAAAALKASKGFDQAKRAAEGTGKAAAMTGKVVGTTAKAGAAVATGGAAVAKEAALGVAVHAKTAPAAARQRARAATAAAAASGLRPREVDINPAADVAAAHRSAPKRASTAHVERFAVEDPHHVRDLANLTGGGEGAGERRAS